MSLGGPDNDCGLSPSTWSNRVTAGPLTVEVIERSLDSIRIKFLTQFVAGDQVEALLEYARAGDEVTFKELAGLLGVPADQHEGMYLGTVALIQPRPSRPTTSVRDCRIPILGAAA